MYIMTHAGRLQVKHAVPAQGYYLWQDRDGEWIHEGCPNGWLVDFGVSGIAGNGYRCKADPPDYRGFVEKLTEDAEILPVVAPWDDRDGVEIHRVEYEFEYSDPTWRPRTKCGCV